MKNKFYTLLTIVTVFLMLIEFLLSRGNYYFTQVIVLSGTLTLAMTSLLSYYISVRSIGSNNPYSFVNGVMAATFVKFFLCIIAVVLLLFLTHKKLHKPDLFLLMFVYVIYTVLETAMLVKVSKYKE